MHLSSQWPRKHPKFENLGDRAPEWRIPRTCEHHRHNFLSGIWKDKIIGTFEIENVNVTGDYTPKSVNQKIVPTPSIVALGFFSKQSGAETHRPTRIRTYLNRKCHNYWIIRQGPVGWQTRSLDLSLCDFSWWDVTNQGKYTTPVTEIEGLKRVIKFIVRQDNTRNRSKSLIFNDFFWCSSSKRFVICLTNLKPWKCCNLLLELF